MSETKVTNKEIKNAYVFSAVKNGTQGSIADTAQTKITGWTETFDPSSSWDNANSKFIAPVTGYYQINASLHMGTTNAWKMANMSLQIRIDNVDKYTSYNIPTVYQGYDLTLTYSGLVYMTAGQYLELFGAIDSSDGVASNCYASGTQISGYLVSE